MKKAVTNGRIVTPEGIFNGYVEWEGSSVTALGRGEYCGEAEDVHDACGKYVSAGFIDIHLHGAGGHDFMDGTEEAFLKASEMALRHGATSIFPTTLASDNESLFRAFGIYDRVKDRPHNGAHMLGLHLEGPYFSYNMRGAQDPKYLRDPKPEEYLRILAASGEIKRVSVAPELNGALEFGRELRARDILPSIAHSDALFDEAVEAFENGYTHVTHLYSCTSSVVRRNAYRYAGIVEAAYYLDNMTVEIITDGVHLPKSLLQLVYKLKGPEKTVLITDSMRAAGMPEGESILGSLDNGMKVIVEDGVAKLPDRSAFAGSVATADRCVRTMYKLAGVPLHDAVRMMTLTPAQVMKVDDRKGELAPGKDADIIIFDDDINILHVFLSGEHVSDNEN